MFRTQIRRFGLRQSHDLMYKGNGKIHSGFKQPYALWVWKQNELFRNIMENQFEHLRNVYKRQWYEAYRVNADEYIYKYNITKAAQMVQWEREMEDQDKARRDALEMSSARKALRAKHRDILKEYNEREFFRWYERASERLQYMSKMKFVKKEDLDNHVEAELNKYVRVPGSQKSYPLNFVGQMPVLETPMLEIASVPRHLAQQHRAQFPKSAVEFYDPPFAEGEAAKGPAAGGRGAEKQAVVNLDDVSAEVFNVDDAVSLDVADELASEQEILEKVRTGGDSEVQMSGEKDRQINALKYKLRGKIGYPKANLRRRPETDSATPSGDGATTAGKGRRGRAQSDAVDTMLSPEELAAAAKSLKGRLPKKDASTTSSTGASKKPRKGEILERPQKLADTTAVQDEGKMEEALRKLAEATGTGQRYTTPVGLKDVGPSKARPKAPSEVVDPKE